MKSEVEKVLGYVKKRETDEGEDLEQDLEEEMFEIADEARENQIEPKVRNIQEVKEENKDQPPVFIETVNQEEGNLDLKLDGKYHIFILLHGLDATYLNMIKLMKYISLYCPNAEFILPQCTFPSHI